MIKIIITNNSMKCIEIANELANFGILSLIRPDFSGKITPELRAVILDKSNKDSSTKTPVAPIEKVKTFVLTNEDISQISEENGVFYMPVALPTKSIVSLVRQGVGITTDLRKIISKFLMDIGTPVHMKGYRLLTELIAMAIECPDPRGRFHNEFYPVISQKFGIREDCIERNIRTVLQGMHERHENGYFKQFFGYYTKTPTVTEFINIVAEKIKNEIL
ncbi:MAG: sporulation initiation factor Spo0A C-terminal domain-containing protein [Ruminococcus sp.]|nr:sporulation initiation factor Spo0A C-terminal domain-containing protein [Ruminococcus sp.]